MVGKTSQKTHLMIYINGFPAKWIPSEKAHKNQQLGIAPHLVGFVSSRTIESSSTAADTR